MVAETYPPAVLPLNQSVPRCRADRTWPVHVAAVPPVAFISICRSVVGGVTEVDDVHLVRQVEYLIGEEERRSCLPAWCRSHRGAQAWQRVGGAIDPITGAC